MDRSWKLCYAILSHGNGPSESLARFLGDAQTQDILLHPFAPYAKSNNQILSTFETKTSAINTSQSPNSKWNIEQIKEDALWLSGETKIDQVSALRTAILAWQNRAAFELLRSDNSSTNSLGDSMLADGEEKGAEDREQDQRRARLAETLLSERCHILKCSEYILAHLLCAPSRREIAEAEDQDVVAEIGRQLLSRWAPEASAKGKIPAHLKPFPTDAVNAIRSRLQSLTEGSKWSGLGDEQESFEITWGMAQAIELIHIMQILQDLLQTRTSLAPGDIILPWFTLMAECGFMQGFQLPYPGLETIYNLPLQSLAALISLTLLDINRTLELLSQPSTQTSTTPSSSPSLPYIFNHAVTRELNDLIIAVAAIPTASPAVMAWSIITQTIRELATNNRDVRETRISTKAADKFGAGDSSDNESNERSTTRGPSSLRRASSTSSNDSAQSTLVEEIYDSISITEIDDDPIAYLANNAAEDGKVFDVIAAISRQYCTPYGYEHGSLSSRHMRSQLLHLIRNCVNFVDYQPALLIATIAVVNGATSHWDIVDQRASDRSGLATLLRQDEMLKERIFLIALSRFPHETLPFLQICRALSDQDNERDSRYNIWVDLRELSIFTCMLPSDYQAYKNINEDAEVDYIELTDNYFFDLSTSPNPSVKRGLRYHDSYHTTRPGIQIERGCQGRVLSDGKPLVVGWHMPYSGLSYIGTLLQSASNGHITGNQPGSPVSSEIVAEAIDFLTALLQAAIRGAKTHKDVESVYQTASSILGQASDGLDRNDDVVSVILQIFENELYKQRGGQEEEDPLNVLVACVHFTRALVSVMPDRVWPFLGRSGLLGLSEEGGRLGVIVSTYEIVGCQYDFLFGCIRLYDALIEDVVRNAVARRAPSKALTRFGSDSTYGAGVSEAAMKKVLMSLQRNMMDIFDSFRGFKYIDLNRRSEIGYWLCNIFRKLIDYSYCIDTNRPPGSNLTGALEPAAEIVLEVFLPQSKTHLAVDPLLQMFKEGLGVSFTSLPSLSNISQIRETKAALQFTGALIQAGIFLGKTSPHINSHLFKEISLLTKLYALEQEFRLPVAELIETLIRSASSDEQQPPSLLAHMGQHDARRFLELLSLLDRPVNDDSLNVAIWRLLGSILGTRQQWFAHFILTGRTPSHEKKETDDQSTQLAEPMFNHALDGLSNIDSLKPRRALAMLEFVVSAMDHWPHILRAVNDHPRFILAIPNFASSIKADDGRKVSTTDYNGIKMVAYITDILAMYCRWTIQEGNTRFADEALKHLTTLAANTVVAPNYNKSLHANLKQNFATKFPGCTLTDFQSTGLKQPSLGESFFFDFPLANQMLSHAPAWHGRAGKGFAGEFRRANLNLSVVDAQVALFQSWKSLLFELSGPLAQSGKYQKIVAETIIECLRANSENDLPESFFKRLAQARADLAFTLLEVLNRAKSTEPEVRNILLVAWNTLRNHNVDLAAAFSAEDAEYHRMLVRILFLSLQIHTIPPATPDANNQSALTRPNPSNSPVPTILDIITTLVSNGFRSLTALLYSNPSLVLPSDFSLLTAIFTTTLRIPLISQQTTHLASLTSAQLPRSASALLSWSPPPSDTETDPCIYGEAALLFLLELSSIPHLAESLAVDATVSTILTTPFLQKLQARAFGPLDRPGRMFEVWTKGLLPLFLNLLSAVGAPMAAEVAAAVNTFSAQLARASAAFSHSNSSSSSSINPSSSFGQSRGGKSLGGKKERQIITLAMAQEQHSLALIVKVLDTFRAAGASAGIDGGSVEEIRGWDAQGVRQDIEGWLSRRGALRERIVAGSEREERWGREKGREGESALEEKIVWELRGVVGVLGG